MRVAMLEQPRLDCPPVDAIPLNRECRDEIIPILRALQHVYSQVALRQEILDHIGQDVNRVSSPDRGREGLSYWTILVLAAVRLGCNFDYDRLQDLAEQHRTLRLMMGIGDWDEQEDFDWRRIRDNVCLLRPVTLEKINHLLVAAGHQLAPQAIEAVRGDTFVVETNVHYPTESTLIAEGVVARASRIRRHSECKCRSWHDDSSVERALVTRDWPTRQHRRRPRFRSVGTRASPELPARCRHANACRNA
jgi:transposase, IS5 family